METTDQVIIKLSKTKIVLLTVGAWAFVAAGAWLLLLDTDSIEAARRYNPVVLKAAGVAAVVFFGACGLYGLVKLFDSRPGLILDSSGLTDNASAAAVGLIPWNEIEGFGEFETHGQKMLVVLVTDPDKYAASGNALRRALNKANRNMVGSPISISANALKVDYAQLTEVCLAFHRRFGGVH